MDEQHDQVTSCRLQYGFTLIRQKGKGILPGNLTIEEHAKTAKGGLVMVFSLRRMRWMPVCALFSIVMVCAGVLTLAQSVVFDEQRHRSKISDGLELLTIRQFGPDGWLNIFALEIDRTQPHIIIDTLLGHDVLTDPEIVRTMAERRGAIGAVNGDFFYINTSGAPLGPHIQGGELIKSGSGGRNLGIGIPSDPDAIPIIAPFTMQLTAQLANGTDLRVDGWNDVSLGNGQIVLYNKHWAAYAQGPDWPDLAGASGVVHVVVDAQGQVVEILVDATAGPPIPAGGSVLAGRGPGATRLVQNIQIGDTISVTSTIAPAGSYTAVIGGNPTILRNGQIVPGIATDVHPRTAVGYSADGSTVWLVVVDGRSSRSRGVSLPELAEIMQTLGAHDAINLDGGGSSTMVARLPGSQNPPSISTGADRPPW